MSSSYQVNLQSFQGPLDLLLFLIKRKKIEVLDIPLASITREYLRYLDQVDKLDLEREAEFLLLAALLIYIKSQMLLPREKVELDQVDSRQAPTEEHLDYQKIKAASALLREREDQQLKKWQRMAPLPLLAPEEAELVEVSLFDLAEAFFELIKRKKRQNIRIVKGKEVSVEEKMNEILAYLKEHAFLDFFDFFSQQETLEEALVSFFCLLELIKARLVIALQESLFHTIKVWLRKERQT